MNAQCRNQTIKLFSSRLTAAAIGACCVAGWAATPAHAGMLVNDQFNDGLRSQTAAGIGAGTGGETEIPWFQNASTISIVTDNTSPLSGSAMQPSAGAAAVGTFATGASNLSLAVGDSLVLSVGFHFTSAGTGNARFGIYNDNGTSASDAAAAGAPYTGDRGYLFIALQSGANNNYTREIDNTGALAGGSDQTNFPQTGVGNPALGTAGHTMIFTLTHTANGMQMEAQIDGNSYGIVNDASATITSFGEIVVDSTGGVNFDNITLTSAPEPASVGLLGIAAVGLLRRRRRAAR